MTIALVHPVPGAVLTDRFGPRAAIPGVVAAQLHSGQDYSAATGTPVLAAHTGTITNVWWDTFADGTPAGGNMVEISADGYATRYAHLDSPAVYVGQTVTVGEVIGWVGSTGAATGPHLHFELLIGTVFVDPVPYIEEEDMTPAQAKQLAEVHAALHAMTKAGGTLEKLPRRTADATLDTKVTRHPVADKLGQTTLRQMIAKQETLLRRILARLDKALRPGKHTSD